MSLILGALVAGVIEVALAARLLLLFAVGTGLGAGIGCYLGRPRASAKVTQLRSVVVLHALRAPQVSASFKALLGRPIAQVMAWANPKGLRWPFIWASLTVPIGASAIEGLFVIGTWAILFYMVALLTGVARVAWDRDRKDKRSFRKNPEVVGFRWARHGGEGRWKNRTRAASSG